FALSSSASVSGAGAIVRGHQMRHRNDKFRILASMLVLAAGIGRAAAQGAIHNPGVVTFQNTETAGANHKVYQFPGGEFLVGTQWVAELYYLDTGTGSLNPIVASISHFKTSTTTAPGTWSGPPVPVNLPLGYGGVDVFDDGSGETGDFYPVTLAVRVWDSSRFSTYEAAMGI